MFCPEIAFNIIIHKIDFRPEKSGAKKPFSSRRMSLADLGLATLRYPTQFDEVDEDEDGDAPGAFKRPKSAFALAKSDLKSKDWQSEIEGDGPDEHFLFWPWRHGIVVISSASRPEDRGFESAGFIA
jgi:hypothetical protein